MLEKKSSRYRKIECRMWGDEKFCSLSPILPSGQALWIYLLTGPHTNLIPGLFRSGEAAMAENLDWPLEGFREAFREVFREGMAKGDWKAKIIWVQNAIFCNKPASSNVVLSWSTEWDLIPECELKLESYKFLESAMVAFGEAYVVAFRKACRKPSLKASRKPSGNPPRNQEQEQEQEQNLSQILLSNDDVVGRPNVESNVGECGFPLVLDTLTGEVIESGTFEIGVPRIEGKVDKTHMFKNGTNVQIELVQSCPKVVQKDKKVKNGQSSSKFDLFWKTYPYKQKKKYSLEIWKRKKLDVYIDIILEDLAQRTDWNAGSQFTPLPSSYLNGERWNDEDKNERKKKKDKSYLERMEELERLEELEKQNQTEE